VTKTRRTCARNNASSEVEVFLFTFVFVLLF
jgi:hypothetical protein